MMPPVMSVHTLMAEVDEPAATVIIRMPGTRKSTYGPLRAASPSPAPIGPPRMKSNRSNITTGLKIEATSIKG